MTVLDVTVVADNADFALRHGRKGKYYDTPAIREWVRDRYGPGEVTYSAIALNWRGSMAIPSARGFRSLGVSGALLGLISFDLGARKLDCESLLPLSLQSQTV